MKFLFLAFSLSIIPMITVAQSVDPSNPRSIVNLLQDLGYRARLDTDNSGDPRIESAIGGTNYMIWFYGCSDNQSCKEINLSAGFDLKSGVGASTINSWNRQKLVGKAYTDEEGDPFIDYFVVADGGISRIVFERVLVRWEIALEEFKEEIGW